jgi:hypothetical protein
VREKGAGTYIKMIAKRQFMENSIGADGAIGKMAVRIDLGKGLFESFLKVEPQAGAEVTHVLL